MTQDTSDTFEQLLREAAELPVDSGVHTDSDDGQGLPRPGDVVEGKYRIEQRLGKGGMGVVFRARHIESGGTVALKWLLRRSSLGSQRLIREARAAGQIDHPNAVKVFDVGSHAGRRYLVMELLRGRSLRASIHPSSPLSAGELVGIMLPVLQGLSAVHKAGVIHRDLKPDNIFLCEGPDGKPRGPKILDFGISKLFGCAEDRVGLTGDGRGPGTLPYMAPEQIEDPSKVDLRTDIYAAGVVMYEALSGRVPFRARSDHALQQAILTQEPAPLCDSAPGVPASLERIVMRAMAKQPQARYQSAEALIEALERLPAEEPRGFPRPWRAFRRQTRWLSRGALAAGSLLLITWWLFGHSAAKSIPAQPSAHAVPSSNFASVLNSTLPPAPQPELVPRPIPCCEDGSCSSRPDLKVPLKGGSTHPASPACDDVTSDARRATSARWPMRSSASKPVTPSPAQPSHTRKTRKSTRAASEAPVPLSPSSQTPSRKTPSQRTRGQDVSTRVPAPAGIIRVTDL